VEVFYQYTTIFFVLSTAKAEPLIFKSRQQDQSMRVFVILGEEVLKFEEPLTRLLRACFGSSDLSQEYLWFVVTEDRELVGCASVDIEEHRLWNLCVVKHHRRRGVARVLLREVVKRFPRIKLYVERGNVGARRLYSRMHFIETEKTDWMVDMVHAPPIYNFHEQSVVQIA